MSAAGGFIVMLGLFALGGDIKAAARLIAEALRK